MFASLKLKKKTINLMAPPIVYGNRNGLKSLPIKQIQK